MKKNIALIVLLFTTLLNGIVPLQSVLNEINGNESTVAFVSSDNGDKRILTEWVDAIKQDNYSTEELKDMYALFKGAELWISKTNALGANDTVQVLDRFTQTQKALNIVFDEKVDKQLENMFVKYKPNDISFEDAKSSIAKDMLYIANSIESSL